jgi:hypothetical protein
MIPAIEQLQTFALDHMAINAGTIKFYSKKLY